jgi:hypothetical protein
MEIEHVSLTVREKEACTHLLVRHFRWQQEEKKGYLG